MKFAARPTLILIAFLSAVSNVDAQEVTRDLAIVAGGTLEIVNRNGRIAVKAEPDTANVPASVKAFSPAGLADEDLKIGASGGRITITVAPKDKQKRIDIVLTVPERISIKAETLAGAIEAAGNFASVEARSDTGTIMA